MAASVDLSHRHHDGILNSSNNLQLNFQEAAMGNKAAVPASASCSAQLVTLHAITHVAMGGQWPGSAPATAGKQQLCLQQVVLDKCTPVR